MDSSSQIQEIKDKLDIVDIVGKYVSLKKTGKNFIGLCPFHKEKTPSFIVSQDVQRYKCFGCGEYGDIFNFIQKIENLDFPESLEKLAKIAGVELKTYDKNNSYKKLEEINYLATKYYYKQLPKSPIAVKYINERGLNKESIKTFGIGYAPVAPKFLQEINSLHKYSKKDLIDSGVFTDKRGFLKEKFVNRIMFPIRSRRGTVIGFTGRILPNDKWGPKYINSPETEIYHKKDNLFAQYESRQEIRKQDLAIVCEGSMDVISAHQHGFKNIVAPLGTSATTEQFESLSHLTKNVLLFFDSDFAGAKALVRAFKIASELEMNPYAANCSPYKDIDEMLQKEPNKMQSLIDNKKEAFSYILSTLVEGKDLNKLEDIMYIKNEITPIIESVKDQNAKELYINKFEKITKQSYISNNTRYTQKARQINKKFHVNDEKPLCISEKYICLLLSLESVPKDLLLKEKFISPKELLPLYRRFAIIEDFVDREKLYKEFENDKYIQGIIEGMIFSMNDIPADKEKTIEEIKQLQKKIKLEYYKEKQKEISVKIAMNEEMGEDGEKLLERMQRITKILADIQNEPSK